MDNTVKEEVTEALKVAKDSRESLTASKDKLKAYFAKLRVEHERHLASMEAKSNHKLEELVKEQTGRIDRAENEIKQSMSSPEKGQILTSALKELKKCSNTHLEFEISPDLDRLRFQAELGLLRAKTDSKKRQKKVVRFCRPASEMVRKSSPDYVDDPLKEVRFESRLTVPGDDNVQVEDDSTVDSGFLLISSRVTKDKLSEKDSKCKNRKCGQSDGQKLEVTSKENGDFVTMASGKVVTISKTKGHITLLNKECKVLSAYQVEHPKAICSVKSDIVLVAIETPTHDKILEMKVTGNELAKVNAVRIKCHDRICNITRKGMSVYVECSGNHLHILDSWRD